MKVNMMILLFAILALSSLKQGSAHVPDIYKNVALRGKASQSSLHTGGGIYHPHNAIDGNRNSYHPHGSCVHTFTERNPWWRVDLLKLYTIISVTITKLNCCEGGIRGARIVIGTSLENNGMNNPQCSVIDSFGKGDTKTFHCPRPMIGRYVTVYLPRLGNLLLCEVEVNARSAVSQENVALRGRASQSSQWRAVGLYNAINAIDGNPDSNHAKGSCVHTQRDLNPWWRVDLLKVYTIFSVTITKLKCCEASIRGAHIVIGTSLENNGMNNPRCSVIGSFGSRDTKTFYCPQPMIGRYVTVYKPRLGSLAFCEIEVNTTIPFAEID